MQQAAIDWTNSRPVLKTKSDRDFVLALAQQFLTEATLNGKVPYFVTTTYLESNQFPLSAPKASFLIKKFHYFLLTQLAHSHNISRPWFRAIEPSMYCFLDIPASKSKPIKGMKIPVHESSFHHHSIFVAHPQHAQTLDAWCDRVTAAAIVETNKHLRLRSLDVQRIQPDLENLIRVTDYCSAYARKRLNDLDALTLFPKSDSEFRSPRRPAADDDSAASYVCCS